MNSQDQLRRVPGDYVEHDKDHARNQDESGDQNEDALAEKNEHRI